MFRNPLCFFLVSFCLWTATHAHKWSRDIERGPSRGSGAEQIASKGEAFQVVLFHCRQQGDAQVSRAELQCVPECRAPTSEEETLARQFIYDAYHGQLSHEDFGPWDRSTVTFFQQLAESKEAEMQLDYANFTETRATCLSNSALYEGTAAVQSIHGSWPPAATIAEALVRLESEINQGREILASIWSALAVKRLEIWYLYRFLEKMKNAIWQTSRGEFHPCWSNLACLQNYDAFPTPRR